MRNDTVVRFRKKDEIVDPLTQLLREGAQRLISQAVSTELELLLEHHGERREGEGRRAVVRNGYLPEREVLTGIGPVSVQVPKVRDRSDEGVCFRSGLVPRYVRRARAVEAVLPWLYLKGVSTGNMQEALTAFGTQFRDYWTNLTQCASDYAVSGCDNFNGGGPTCDPDKVAQQPGGQGTGCPAPVFASCTEGSAATGGQPGQLQCTGSGP